MYVFCSDDNIIFDCLYSESAFLCLFLLHDIRFRPVSRVDQVDFGLPSRVKSVCSSIDLFQRR